ncbi:MAG: PEP-CTERM sorting domain-containing protein [Desulfuromonadales bacterium]|nr:PEP-CTERM sorting domain-containing protein [Desulfuromonadales bacterium]
MKKVILITMFLTFFAVGSAFATPGCLVTDATANGYTADACYQAGTNLGNPADEADFINSATGSVAPDTFNYVAKYEDPEGPTGLSGWSLMVYDDSNDVGAPNPWATGYSFAYTLMAPEEYAGKEVSFALGVKQASSSFIAYVWDTVTLDINGFFNSTWNGDQDYSHVTAFVKGAAPVPEPSTLLLLGAGIAGLAIYRRKRK